MRKYLKVHYFQHIAKEGFGSCETYLRGYQSIITATEFFALPPEQKIDIDALPRVDDVDLLIVMGGPMSVNDEENYPWLIVEKRWLRRFIALGKPVIGLCLGGQMIANALGAKVTANPVREIGWTQVDAVQPYPVDCFAVPSQVEIMQWHGETFSLPKGAVRLAENEACQNQAFQLGTHVLAFQFHPEITPVALSVFLEDEEEVSLFEVENKNIKAELEQASTGRTKRLFEAGNRLLEDAIDYVVERYFSMQSL